MSSKTFTKQFSHGGIEIQSDSHGDTLMLLPNVVSKIVGVSMADMTEDTPILILHVDGSDHSLEVPFASRTNIKRAYDQVIAMILKTNK